MAAHGHARGLELEQRRQVESVAHGLCEKHEIGITIFPRVWSEKYDLADAGVAPAEDAVGAGIDARDADRGFAAPPRW